MNWAHCTVVCKGEGGEVAMATKPGALTEYPWTNFGAWKVSSQLRLLDSTHRKLLLPSIDLHFGLPWKGGPSSSWKGAAFFS